MTAITITDLNNAKIDVDHIAEIATSTSPTATDRMGHVKRTIVGAIADAVAQTGAYATEAEGRAAAADGKTFRVQGSGDVASYEYRRTNSSISVLISTYPSINATRAGQRAGDAIGSSLNLFDITACTFGKIVDAVGALDTYATFETSGKIVIKVGQLHTTNVAIFSLAYYDSTGAFVGPLVVCAASTFTFTPPFDAYSVRVTFASGTGGANRQTMMIVEGAALPGTYVAYSSALMPMNQFAAIDDRSADYRTEGTNLFNRERATLFETISGITGATGATASAYFVSGFMPVVGGRVYRVSNNCYNFAVFDANKRFITGDESGWMAGTTRTMPPCAAWIRIDSVQSFLDRLHVSAGASAPAAYQRFGGVPGPLVGKGVGFRGDSIWFANKIQPRVCGLVGGALEFNTCGDGTAAAWNLASITTLALADTDLIIMEHGINDWKNGAVLGSLADASNATGSFYARLKAEYDTVFTAKPTIRVIRTTPTKTFSGMPSNFAQWNVANGVGLLQSAYVQAIKEVSELYSVPVLDLFAMSNINAATEATLLYDHLHWTDALYDRIAVQVARFAEANF